MLTHRTNLLLEETDYRLLSQLATQKKVSIGKLIRHAVKKTYSLQKQDTVTDILNNLQKLSLKVNTKNINYRELINEGRK
jgi:hypothetical protein